MDITQLILDDHAEQRRLFAIIEQIDPKDTDALSAVWSRLSAFLDVHAEAEERYAACVEALTEGAPAPLVSLRPIT